MSDSSIIMGDPRVSAYLARVHAAVGAVDPALASAVTDEISEHIRDAASEPGFDLATVLARLGDPALIAAGIEPSSTSEAARRPPDAFADSSFGVILTVVALTIGTWTTLLIGWAIGVGILWVSQRWNSTDKLLGTAAWPMALLAGLLGGALGVRDVGISALIGLPALAGVWLLVRGLAPSAATSAAVRTPPRVRPHPWGFLDRWPALAVSVATAAVSTVFVVLGAGGAVGGAVAAAMLVVSVVVLWLSRGWTRVAKGLGTGLAAAATLSALASATAAESGGPGVAAELLVQAVVPLSLAYVVVLAARFAPAGTPAALTFGRALATPVVAALTVGGVGFPLLLLARLASAQTGSDVTLLGFAMALLGVWVAALVLIWRSDGWTPVDRVLAGGLLPLLVCLPLLLPMASPAAQGEGINPLVPGQVEAAMPATVWMVLGIAATLVAVWLLVRFEPSRAAGEVAKSAPRRAPRGRARPVAVLGVAVVLAYAVVAAMQILVWNPLAAVPGAELEAIYAHLEAVGERFSVAAVIAILLVGPLLALVPLAWAWRGGSAIGVSAAVFAIIAAGAVGYWVAAFGPGMSLADAYGISGGDHAPWGRTLMMVSAVAAIAALVGGIAAGAKRGSSARLE